MVGAPGSGRAPRLPTVPKPSIGLVVNPVAGMGGRVGLKGSDGAATLAAARERGAVPVAPERVVAALAALAPLAGSFDLIVAPGEMGADEARACGIPHEVVGSIPIGATTAADTRAAAAELARRGVDLLLFGGGDGTAVDVLAAVGDRVTVLGIPAGVKMHSAVFGVTPRRAGELAALVAAGRPPGARPAEVLDLDEDDLRSGEVSPRLHGALLVPAQPRLVQGLKSRSRGGEDEALAGIAAYVLERVGDRELLVVGPGTTTGAITARLGLPHTLLGVDAVRTGRLVAADADERRLLELLDGGEATIVVTPVGGQGFLLGRGNQQLSPSVLRRVGRERLVVVATESKIAALGGRPLLVDTGDAALDDELSGHARIVTGHNREIVYPVAA